MSDERDVDVLSTGDPGVGRRTPGWLWRGMAAVAVVAVAALAGRELLGGPDDRDEPVPTMSPAGPRPGAPLPHDPATASSVLVGTLGGRIVRVLPDGTVQRGPRIRSMSEVFDQLPEGIELSPQWPWRNHKVAVRHERVLYVSDGKLRVVGGDISQPPRTVTEARGVLQCEDAFTKACVVTDRGAVVRVRLSDGKVIEPVVVPRETYAGGGWQPLALLADGLVLVRPADRVDVAIVPAWDDELHVVARDVRLLGAYRRRPAGISFPHPPALSANHTGRSSTSGGPVVMGWPWSSRTVATVRRRSCPAASAPTRTPASDGTETLWFSGRAPATGVASPAWRAQAGPHSCCLRLFRQVSTSALRSSVCSDTGRAYRDRRHRPSPFSGTQR